MRLTHFFLLFPVLALATNISLTPSSDFISALANANAGDTLFFEAGTYNVSYAAGSANTITLSKTGTATKPIVLYASGHATAIFDFNFPEFIYIQNSYGFYVTGSYYEFHGIGVTRAGYQGTYVTGSYNSFDNCAFFENRNSGLEINKGGNHTTVIHTDSYRNYDPKKKGSMSDGFASKQTQGAGNTFTDCRAWENSDDGFDFYDSPDSVIVTNSWAFRNGVNVFGYADSLWTGNQNGFKMGGNAQQANHHCTRCVAFDNPGKGFDQNNNSGGITIEQSIAYRNGINFGMGGALNDGQAHVLKNNITFSSGSSDSYGTNSAQKNNSWNLNVTVSKADFASLDTSLARSARDSSGKIIDTTLFRLVKGSDLIDAGADIGYGYQGSAPDLGPFEYIVEGITRLTPNEKTQTKSVRVQNPRYFNLLGKS
ncbi:MAG: right-handed parallel beta-helix repeat-containing protein, partial [Fibrobacteraceae bacterium]|nr:right-handed parallel beta-helix repeat-containing protein [Fibrobacteraceae bacterium]